MSRLRGIRSILRLGIVLVAMSGCDPSVSPAEVAGNEASPPASPEEVAGDEAGPCERATTSREFHAEAAELDPEHPTQQATIDAFLREHRAELDGAVVDDTRTIRRDGHEIGEVRVEAAPAGGYLVSYAWWCMPPGDDG